ncbi:hypothetical protein [Microcoleus sp.]|uniref:hypothetical protein n=1 Tax=Microcoleus sp. TaxID=44472 RepID=UPI0035240A50
MISQKPTTLSSQFRPIAPKELKPSPPTNIPDRSPSQDVPTARVSTDSRCIGPQVPVCLSPKL